MICNVFDLWVAKKKKNMLAFGASRDLSIIFGNGFFSILTHGH